MTTPQLVKRTEIIVASLGGDDGSGLIRQRCGESEDEAIARARREGNSGNILIRHFCASPGQCPSDAQSA